jgi:rhodanese-related sulfurtransferase
MPRSAYREDVRRLIELAAQVVEVLPPEEYERYHIKGAINLPLDQLNAQTAAQLDRNRPVVVYCNDFQ